MNASTFATGLYRSMDEEQLLHTIDKLERMVRSLERAGSERIAVGYRDALDLARAERERRRV